MTRLLIARHGNTFDPGQTPLRIGLRSDLPLSVSGQQQGQRLGEYLGRHYSDIVQVVVSELQRTQQTAQIALQAAGLTAPVVVDAGFNEIDYGPDEGKPEAEVIARLGQSALTAWDEQGQVPAGWQVDVEKIIQHWRQFASQIQQRYPKKTVLVVTSNGIARFAPYLTGDFAGFCRQYKIKLKTGGLGSLLSQEKRWLVEEWNIKPA